MTVIAEGDQRDPPAAHRQTRDLRADGPGLGSASVLAAGMAVMAAA